MSMPNTTPESKQIIDVEDRTFDQEVLQRSMQTPVLVDFWAPWCAPCKALTPVLAKVAEDFAGACVLAKVNADENQQLAQQCGIRSLPTVLLIKGGQIVDGFVGAQPENAIRALLARHGIVAGPKQEQEPSPPPCAIAATERPQAIATLRRALQEKPEDAVLATQLADLLVAEGEYEEALTVLKQLPQDKRQGNEVARVEVMARFGAAVKEAPDESILAGRIEGQTDSEASYLLGLRKAIRGDHEGALALLLALVKRDRKFGDDAARKAIVDIFTLLGGSGPLVKQYRSMLYSALN
jgi:putative thioredoxin